MLSYHTVREPTPLAATIYDRFIAVVAADGGDEAALELSPTLLLTNESGVNGNLACPL
eukprot:COSAG05_NODE_16646_length_341_cov_1.289256_1_plen_57_part_10